MNLQEFLDKLNEHNEYNGQSLVKVMDAYTGLLFDITNVELEAAEEDAVTGTTIFITVEES